nr:MAG TPA: hypothetical protein [Caudoviricetes sp.]
MHEQPERNKMSKDMIQAWLMLDELKQKLSTVLKPSVRT